MESASSLPLDFLAPDDKKEMFAHQPLSPRLFCYNCSDELSLTKVVQAKQTPLWVVQREFRRCSLELYGGIIRKPERQTGQLL